LRTLQNKLFLSKFERRRREIRLAQQSAGGSTSGDSGECEKIIQSLAERTADGEAGLTIRRIERVWGLPNKA
jgi:hypothetical protein